MRFLNFTGTDNIGDNVCSPQLYFGDRFPVGIDARSSSIGTARTGENAIVGGGGILFPPVYHHLQRLGPSVAWGIGTNVHGSRELRYPPFLKRWMLVGLRDWPRKEYDWVPCPSCMHEEFDDPGRPTEKLVIYQHKDAQIGIHVGAKRDNNRGQQSDFHSKIEFLKRGETVITNTYHGAYWSLLLGRPVMIYHPFSSRFHFLPCQRKGKLLTPLPNMLELCRQANESFCERVLDLLRHE